MMLRYALRTIRDRKSGFLGALLALMCAAALITACGTLLETGLRGRIATERYAGAPLVVSADQNVHRTTVKHKSNGETKAKHKAKPVVERAWLPAATADRIRPLEGVRKVIPELTFLAEPVTEPVTEPVDRPSYGHSWASASITPFTLTTGRAPATADDIVIDRGFAERVGLKPGDRLTVQSTGTPGRTASAASRRRPAAVNSSSRPPCSSSPPRPSGSPPAPARSPPSACCPRPARTPPS